jgi:serine protease Do
VDSSSCAVGNGAFVIGFPMGVTEKTLLAAHIASITNTGLRIDASVNHGNSGGPLFNMQGEQIGVVNAKHGSLSQLLTQIKNTQPGAMMSIGGIDPVKAIQGLIGEMQKNLNLGIGYAIKTADIKPLHSILDTCIL